MMRLNWALNSNIQIPGQSETEERGLILFIIFRGHFGLDKENRRGRALLKRILFCDCNRTSPSPIYIQMVKIYFRKDKLNFDWSLHA